MYSIVYINKQGNSLKIVTRGSGIYVLKNNTTQKIIEKNSSSFKTQKYIEE